MKLVDVHWVNALFSKQRAVSYSREAEIRDGMIYVELDGDVYVKPISEIKQARVAAPVPVAAPVAAPVPTPEPIRRRKS